MIKNTLILLILSFSISCRLTQNIPRHLKEQVMNAIEKSGNNQSQIQKCFSDVNENQIDELSFLIANMPEKDLKSLSSDYILENLKIACEARKKSPWGKDIPDDVFLNDVLPYCIVDEQRDPIRKKFNELFAVDCSFANF